MSDKATRLRRFLDGDIDVADVKDDPLLASLASRIYGVEAEDFEELPMVDDVIGIPGVDIGDVPPPVPSDSAFDSPPPPSSSVPSPATTARDNLSRSAARRRLQGTFPAYFGLLLLVLVICNFFGLFGGFFVEMCQGESKYCPPDQNKIALLSIGEIDTNQGWADELTFGIPDIAMGVGSIAVLFYGLSLRNRGRRLLEFKAVADIIAEDGRVTKEEAIELRDAASRLGISEIQHSSIARELQSMADDGVDLLPGQDASTPLPSLQEPESRPAPSMIDLPPPLPIVSENEEASLDSEDEEDNLDEAGLSDSEAKTDDMVDEETDESGQSDFESVPDIGSSQEVSNPSDDESTLNTPDDNDAPPPIPSDGLPNGWTEEQWQYYGQQYLDSLEKDSGDVVDTPAEPDS
ncbi:MAG: hypothetical protein CMB77_03155 [Euryarchaeota archaeon]|nr:hypothetical protein [Euryarchaeota archaeon]